MRVFIKTRVRSNYNKVFEKFDVNLFKALKPPGLSLEVSRFDGCKKGDEVHLKIGLGPFSKKWVSLITENNNSNEIHCFVDEGKVLPFPLKSWKHTHRVIRLDDSITEIQDDINYSSGFILMDLLMYPAMYFQFYLRSPVYKKFFNS